MTDLYPVKADVAARAHIDERRYEELYARSIEDNENYWAEQAQRVDWIKPFTKVKDVSFARDDLHIRWFYDGTLNACYNCVDRHLESKADDIAIIWEGDDPARDLTITYRQLHERVCKFANALKALGAKKGDRITIYMPMIPEAAVAMLACARIGAVHSVVFGGFSPDALAGRIHDCESNIVITADQGVRGAKACDRLHAAGFDNIVNVEGGIDAWSAAGLPLVRGKKSVSLERQVRIAACAGGQVQERLIDRVDFRLGGKPSQNLHHPARHVAVEGVVRREHAHVVTWPLEEAFVGS